MSKDVKQRGICCENSQKLDELNSAIKDAINCMAGAHVALHNNFDKDELIADLTTAIYRLKEALY